MFPPLWDYSLPLPMVSYINAHFLFFSFCFLGLHPWCMQVPRATAAGYHTATAMRDPSHVCNLHHSSRQNAGSLTHCVRPGIELASSWILVGFTSAVPPRELLPALFCTGSSIVAGRRSLICLIWEGGPCSEVSKNHSFFFFLLPSNNDRHIYRN